MSTTKLLLFSDLHANIGAAVKLVQRAAEADMLVGAGDFGNARRGVGIPIEVLKQINKPAVLVPGNSESAEELVRACADWPSAIVLHGDGVTVAGIRFFGLGGGIPVTPFGAWSYDFTDEEAAEMLSRCDHCDVLVSHSPPLDAVDLSSNGRRLGSPAIRTAVETIRPQLVVCGHIHASSGKQAKIGATTVINAGPAGLMFELTTSF